MKIFFRRIHLYMGLTAGIIIMITCLTGAILVFEKELQQLFHKQRYFTTAGATRLPADSLLRAVKEHVPDGKIASIKFYSSPGRTAEVALTLPAKKQANTDTTAKKLEPTRVVAFVDPYTGAVKEVYNHRQSFFYFVMDAHRWMLGGDIGKMVVGVCTIIFLFIIITGIILWWPRNKAILKQRLKIKTGAGFKRLNHDYHVVLGFYSAIFLFVLAFTGLAWSFEWFNKGIYTVTGSSMDRPKAPKSKLSESGKINVELVYQRITDTLKDAQYYAIALPKDSTEAFAITTLPSGARHESATDTYFVDAFTGKINGIQKFDDRNTGQRIRATFKPVHVASIFGMPSKIIGFIVCLLGTFFPLSGIIMWINRTRRKSR